MDTKIGCVILTTLHLFHLQGMIIYLLLLDISLLLHLKSDHINYSCYTMASSTHAAIVFLQFFLHFSLFFFFLVTALKAGMSHLVGVACLFSFSGLLSFSSYIKMIFFLDLISNSDQQNLIIIIYFPTNICGCI